MTKTARVYGGSLYDLAAEEKLDGQIMEQMNAVRQIFRENPGYLKLLGEPAIPEDERLKMIEEAFGGQAERYLVNFLKLLCERKILREFAGCCEEFIRRYNSAHGIAEAVVTSAVKLSDTQMEALKAKENRCIWYRKQMHPFLADFAWNWRAYSLTVQYRAVFPVFRRN